MSKKSEKSNTPNVVNKTTIGSITGSVHTGSGDILISSITTNNKIMSKEEFLSALLSITSELEAAKHQGLSNETFNQATTEIERIAHEIKSENPKAETIVERLEKARAVLNAGAGVSVAATSAVTAVGKLIPLIDTIIKHVSQMFP